VSIQAADVKKLREKTGAAMMDCKKALVKTEGDFAKAEKMLKEMGLAAAEKRSGRAAKEGKVFVKNTGSKAIVLELSCETDFVGKNKDFLALGENLVQIIDEQKLTEVNSLMEDMVKDALAKIKENIVLRRFIVIEAGDDEILADYLHGPGKIGVIVKLKTGKAELKDNAKVKELAFDLCLHIAAFSPMKLDASQVDPAYLQEQEEIFMKQAENLGKPENVLKGIVKGKVNKHLSEICFVDQGFVKDEKQKVGAVVAALGKELGTDLSIVEYVNYRLGEEA